MSKGIFIEDELMDHEAYIGLTNSAKVLLIYFYRKRVMVEIDGKWKIANNGEIVLRYKDAPGFSADTFARALDQFIERGLLNIQVPGGKNRPTKYWISDRWRKYGKQDFVCAKRCRKTKNGNQF